MLIDTITFKFIKYTYYRFNIHLNRISEGISLIFALLCFLNYS
jgi:hypothetical protein